MKSIYACAAAGAVLLTGPATAQARAPGAHALIVRDGKIVHVRKDKAKPAGETVTAQAAPARSAAAGEHVVAIRNGRIVYIPKRHLEP